MTTAALSAFLAEHWLTIVVGAGLVGGWLWICRELCSGAEPEPDADELESETSRRQRSARSGRLRPVLSSRRQTRHTHPQASLRIRRS